MLTVACVRVGDKYPEDYVERLRSMVARNLSVPHQFECIRRPPQLSGADGCWSKMWLFDLEGDVLYFDLDVVIAGNIDGLVPNGPHLRAMLDPRSMASGAPKLNSSVMSWVSGAYSSRLSRQHSIIRPRGKPDGPYRGDQEFIQDYCGDWEPLAGVHSYKLGIRPDTIVAVFHGEPKPHTVTDDPFVATHWR